MTSETNPTANRFPATCFGLIRHGETSWNRQKKIQGQTQTRLTPEGERQVQGWATPLKKLPWDRILTSDLIRAQKTAEALNATLNLPLHCNSKIREQHWGDWTGRTIRQLRADQPQAVAAQETAGWNFRPPRGESRQEVLGRSREALLETARRWPGKKILVVTHNGVLKCLLYHLSQRPFLPDEGPLIRPFHLHWLQATPKGIALKEINALALQPVKSIEKR
jgi:probable phosphoglycerate mutase